MFSDFRQIVKERAKARGMTYAQLADLAGIKESSIKSFMCENAGYDSRRVAEKLADALEIKLVYENGTYQVLEEQRKEV